MTTEDPDKRLRDLIARVYIPEDVFPSDPEQIEAMLNAAGGSPLSEEQVERILMKARGELPVGERTEQEPDWSNDALTDEERELVALHRNEGEEVPPDVKEKLRQLREQAKTKPREEEDCDDELEP